MLSTMEEMLSEFNINAELRCVFIRFSGIFSIEKIVENYQNILASPEYQVGYNFYMDAQNLNQKKVNYKYMKSTAALIEAINEKISPCKIDYYMGKEGSWGHSRQWTTLLETESVKRMPFRDISEAKNWLDIPDDFEIKF